MSREDTVSVVIPAYNVENSLARTVDSVLSQTYDKTQIIIIDDGSTDGTKQVAEGYGDAIVFLEQSNQGQGAARNKGLEAATGNYIAFLDADDYWCEDFLKVSIQFLSNHQHAIAVSCGQIIKMQNGDEVIGPGCLNDRSWIADHQEATVLEDFFQFWAEHDHVRTGSVLIRHEIIKQAGYQRADLRISQDLEYWGYLATFGQWGFIPKPLWVGSSRVSAKHAGWSNKYRIRRKLCPTVELWEARILTRLEDQQMENFNVVRGRVASGYAHSKILGGAEYEALQITKKYGSTFTNNKLTHLLVIGSSLGVIGWWLTCKLVKLREVFKHT